MAIAHTLIRDLLGISPLFAALIALVVWSAIDEFLTKRSGHDDERWDIHEQI